MSQSSTLRAKRTVRRIKTRRSRRMLLETLESRQLLSATPIAPSQAEDLREGLAALESYADRVETAANLGQALPLMAESFDEQLDLSDVLNERLVTPLSDFLVADSLGDYPSPNQIAAYLTTSPEIIGRRDGLDFAVGPVNVDGVTFDTTLYATRGIEYRVAPGPSAQDLGVRFSEEGLSRHADFAMTFDLAFGLDAGGQFFADVESLEVSVADTVQIVANDPIPELANLSNPTTFTVLINDTTVVTATLPAHSQGNLTPLAARMTQVLAEPLADAGFAGALIGTQVQGRLALRSLSADIRSLRLFDGGGLSKLGFADGQSASDTFSPELDYGLLGLRTEFGGIAANGVLEIFADAGADGRLDLAELTTTAAVTSQSRHGVDLSLAVQPSLPGFVVAGQPTIRGRAARMFDGPPLIVSAHSFDDLDRLHDQVRETLGGGFAAITQFGARLESSTSFSNPVAGLPSSLADIVDFDAVLQAQLQRPIDELLDRTARPSWDDVREALQSVPGVTISDASTSRETATLDIQIESTASAIQQIVFGDDVAEAGLIVTGDAPPELDVNTDLNASMRIEVDRRRTASPLEAFTVRFDTFDTSVTAQGSIALDARVGLLGLTADGAADLDATLSAEIEGGQAIPAGVLSERSMAELVATRSSGAFTLDFPLTAIIGTQTLSASLALPPGDPFGGMLALQPIGFGSLQDFLSFGPGDLAGGLEQIAEWFGDYSNERLGVDVPLTSATRLSDAIDLSGAFRSWIVESLTDGDGMLTFATAQRLASLAPGIVAVDYDASSHQLMFDLEFDQPMRFPGPDGSSSDALAAALGFDWSLGDLVGLTSEASVDLRAGVEARFRIGIDLRPLGHDAPEINHATPLAALNGGRGVMIDPGEDIEIQLRGGDTFRVSFDSVSTLGEAIERMHAARDAAGISGADFAVSFRSESGKTVGLRLTDGSPDRGTDFRVSNIDGALGGLGLGVVGLDEDGDGVIDGKPLHGDTFADHLFVERVGDVPIARGKVDFANSDFQAQGNLGFLAVEIDGGRFTDAAGQPSHVTVAVDLIDSATGATLDRISLADLFRSLDSQSSSISARAMLDGRIELELPVQSTLAASEFGGTVRVSLTGFDGEANSEIEQTSGGDWTDLVQLDAASILDGLRDGLARLLDLDSESAFAAGLPIIDARLPSFVGLDDLLQRVTEAIESIGGSSLLAVADQLGRLSGEPITLPEVEIALPDLVGFAASIRDLLDSSGSGSFALPDLEPLFQQHFNVTATLPDGDIEASSLSGLADALVRRVAELQFSSAGSLQQLESVLASTLDLGPESLNLALDTSTPDSMAVRVDLNLQQAATGALPLQLDLSTLDLSAIGNLIDVSGSSTIALSAGAAATLSLGLDVSAAGVQPFLYAFDPGTRRGTHVALTAGAIADAIEFDASLGPIGVAIVQGSAGINRTGSADDTDPAEFLVTVAGGSGGRIILGDSLTLETQVSGGAFASLPLEIPRGTPITSIEYASADLTAVPDGNSLNISDVKAALEQRIQEIRDAGIGSNLLAMVGGWEGAFDLLIDAMRGEVLGVPLPLIGDALADEADFLEDIQRSVVSNIAGVAEQGAELVQRGIFDALGPGGLDLLQDATSDGALTPDDVPFTFDTLANRVDFDLHLRKAVEAIELPIDFDLGLPGLNLDIDAPVQLSFGADFRLGFGVSLEDGFFFATDTSRTQLELFFEATVPELSAAGQLALLDIIASTIPGSPTRFDGSFVVHLTDAVVGDGNALLAFDEMASGRFSDAIDHTLAAEADVDLNLMVSMGDNSLLPRMRTDLIVDWEFIAGERHNAPEVRFDNVQLNLGDFFGGFAGETLGQVQEIMRPVQPMIDLLTARLPVISDLSGSRVTLVDMARLFGRADVANFAQSLIDVNNLIVGLPQVGPDTWIDLGAFGVAADALGGFSGPGSTAGGSGSRSAVSMIDVQVDPDPLGQAADRGGAGGGAWANNLSNAKGSLSFPLLQSPMTAFQLLLGRDVDLFLYDAPAMGIDFTYSQFFPIPAMPILGAEIAGRLAAVADFAFGFDTSGIREFQQSREFVDIFDGFFVSDRANPDGTGSDVSEAYLRGSLTAGAKLELLIAEAGVRGGVFAGVDFDLHDNDRDGRVRGGELAENSALGPVHIFDVSGRVDAGLVAFVDVNLLLFTLQEEYEIARANLLDFEIQRPAPSGLSPTEILTSRAGDVLTIQFTEQDDNYRVFPGSVPNSIVVQGQGLQTIDLVGIKEIRGNALGGNDLVTIAPEVMIPIWLDGGEGDDQLTAGGGRAVLRGDSGSDVLVGGPGDDHLIGGSGDDRLFGDEGNDLLEGNEGNDHIDGGRGDDVIVDGKGDDVLLGGLGNDTIEGGEGNDILDGGRGNDILRGGLDDDQISGDRGDDVIEGGPGNDVLLGEAGNDRIHGGDGNDIIDGGEGDDVLFGDAGNDTIAGGTGNDRIDGGDGDDVIRGGGGIDTLFGGQGNDEIFADDDGTGNPEAARSVIDAGSGNDVIYGSLGDDRIVGGIGDDTIFALGGNDWIEGGDSNDAIDAGPGDDVVIGGRGDDDLDGGDGNDLLWGGSLVYGPEHFDLGDSSLFELPPRFEEAAAFGGSSYFPPLLITPKVVAGLSSDGSPDDGDDLIRGGAGTDWIFGGGENDTLYGGAGHDYVDGGAGQDTLFGGDDDDVLRGGKGEDVLHGGAGIDQIHGDDGNDKLYSDAGTADGSTAGQRLFGGAGDDQLFAWAAGDASDLGTVGDELWGGAGNDFLYGNGRNDLLGGEAGNDYLHGDWARGPNYNPNPFAAVNFDFTGNPTGSDDRLDGGLGNDQLFGGGGNDQLGGGADDDWLEGQDGHDTLLGGGGIDFLVLDVDPRYHVLGGGRIDGHGNGSPDDHATDMLLINGTSGDDVMRLRASIAGEPIRGHDGEAMGVAAGGQLMVEYNAARMEVVWSEFGIPLVDQFRISGLGGDDQIEFVRGERALDLTPLIHRSRDFVLVIDGGSGNDTLWGTSGRDRIDGGRGSDVIFGLAGDDRLWGDQGANDGSVTDHDVLFAGSGNDDVLGGQGTNELFAWSLDPRVGSSFGVYLGSDGNLYQQIPEVAPTGITFELEDTGLNRIIGSSRDDHLYGGTGVDLLYGNGGNDQLFTREGTPFEDLDGQQAGDEWKAYARSSEHVWYVGGTNTDDVISVDFVTEPGILQGHHLITRLTNNNGSFSFDAQVRLDFSATDGDGNLIWDPNDLLADIDGLQSDNPFTRAEALDRRFSDAAQLSRFLPSEGDFQVIIIDALAGDDVITVGPTVQKTVWIDAGGGGDTVRIESGRAILIDQTDAVDNRNDAVDTAFPLVGPAVLIGTVAAPVNGILTADARFRLIVDDLDQHVFVDIPAALTDGTATGTQPNMSLDDLVDDINGALSRSIAAGRVVASRSGDRIALSTTTAGPESRLAISVAPGNPAITELGLPANDSALPSATLLQSTTLRGLTIDNPADIDHYEFELLPATLAGDRARVTVGSISSDDAMELALFAVGESEPIIEGIDATVGIDLQALEVQAGTSYVLRVSSNAIPTIYDVRFDFGDDVALVGVDLGAIRDFPRRDVIFGGPGSDVLQGGPGEDFMFGGPGNDVLTGGQDGGASDLVFGGAGNDTFQVIPGRLPTLTGTQTSFLPTLSDRLFGGEGSNRAFVLGGDLDQAGRPVNDFFAVRFNRLLQRYEVTALVWDVDNQRYVMQEAPGTAGQLRFEQLYHFFTARDIQTFEIDTRSGDDEVRADAGFVFPNTESQWGFTPGDWQAGAALASLVIRGGDGADRLFGGPEADLIDGGASADVILGGGGDDVILEGSGDDLLAGGTIASPDAYELATRNGQSRNNDAFAFAAELGRIVPGTSITGLNLHNADPADWYIVPAPRALNTFGQAATALLTTDMIAITAGPGKALTLDLYPAQSTGGAAPDDLVPVEQFAGVPEYYLLRVGRAPDDTQLDARPYTIDFSSDIGKTTLASAGDAADKSFDAIELAGQPIIIPVGDFNGDGLEDYILSVSDSIVPGGVSQAALHFGDGTGIDPSLPSVTLALPAPVRTLSAAGIQSVFGRSGDYNGDGYDDLAIAVTRVNAAEQLTAADIAPEGVYLLFGRPVADVPAEGLLLLENADAVIKGFDGRVSLDNAGNVNGDLSSGGLPLDDLVIGEANEQSGGSTYIVHGRETWSTTSIAIEQDFEQGPSLSSYLLAGMARRVENLPSVPGNASSYHLHFGNGVDYDTPELTGLAVVFALDTSAFDPARGVLDFRYALDTNETEGIDIARVWLELADQGESGLFHRLLLASNQIADLNSSSIPLPLEESEIWRDFRYELGPMLRPLIEANSPTGELTLQVVFEFDAVSTEDRTGNGFRVDDVALRSAVNIADLAARADTGFASSVAGVDRFLPNATGAYAVVDNSSADPTEHRVEIRDPSGSAEEGISLSRTGGFAGFEVRAAGDVDGIEGAELILTGRDESYLLFGRAMAAGSYDLDELVDENQARRFDVGNLQATGDFNGDDVYDFAAVELADAIQLDRVAAVTHPRARIYFGSTALRSDPEMTIADLVIEPTSPLFEPAETAKVFPGSLAMVADWNGDGRDELVEAIGGSLHIYLGAAPAPAPQSPSGPDRLAVGRTHVFDLATPLLAGTPAGPSGVDLINDLSAADINDAVTIEGVLADEGIAEVGTVGDVNGDGYDDLLATGSDFAYLLLGPVELDDHWQVADAAAVIFDLTTLGRIVPSRGDLDGDGLNDLVFIQDAENLADVHVIFGSRELPRRVDVDFLGLDPVLGRTGFTFGSDAGSTALLLNWNGDEFSDLAIVGPFGGTIYDGGALVADEFVVLNAFALDDTDRVQLVRRTQGLAAATQVDSFRQFISDSFELSFPDQYFGMDSITYDPETGHLFAHQFDIDQIREFDLEGNEINSWGGLPHMAEEGAISITTAPMRLGNVDLPAYTLLAFMGNWISGRGIVGVDKQLVLAYDKFTGERLAVLETDLPVTYPPVVQMEAGVYHPLRQTLFVLTSQKTVKEIDPVTGVTIHSFTVPIGGTGGGFGSDAVGDIEYDRISGNLLITEQRPHLRIFEMTPDGELVQTVDRPEFSDLNVNGSSAAPSIALDPLSGDAYVAVGDSFDRTQIFKFSGFPRQAAVQGVVAGDTNGDGLDDLLITDQSFVRFRAGSGLDDIGRTYVVPGRTSPGELALLDDSNLVVQATLMSPRGSALGDLDGDGLDDIAVSRLREDGDRLEGSGFVFFGAVSSREPVLDPVAEADIVIRRPDLTTLSPGQSLGGAPVQITGGDFDHNGRGDLVVGLPTTARIDSGGAVLSEEQRGHVYVFFDVEHGEDLRLSSTTLVGDTPADVVLDGVLNGDRLGTLPASGPLDLNRDGVSDLLVGAAGANAALGTLAPGSGRVHVIYGNRQRHDLSHLEPIVIENSALGAFLVDRGTGQPEAFTGTLDDVSSEQWYRFTLLGDGSSRNVLRLSPGRGVADDLHSADGSFPSLAPPEQTVVGSLYDADGRQLAAGFNLLDLRTIDAGTYFLRVQNESAAGLVDYALEITPPILGFFRPSSDRNVIRGGDGDDTIVTSGQDAAFGGSGRDLVIGSDAELRDRSDEDSRREGTADLPDVPHADPIVTIQDPALLAAVADTLGLTLTVGFDGQPFLPTPIHASQLAQIELLNLSGRGVRDVGDLGLLPNLRALNLANNALPDVLDALPSSLTNLRHLGLAGNGIATIMKEQLAKFPRLEGLYLNDNLVSDLAGLVGVQIVNDGDGGYVESGSWQSEASATANAWLDDYRFTKSGGSATWTVAAPLGETVRLWVTWPTLDNESTSETTYQVFDGESLLATLPVFQSTPAGALGENAMFGSRTWEVLGEFASTTGELSIVLAGVDGAVVAADAVRVEQVSPPKLSLQTISLLGNPLNDVSRDELLGRLQEINPDLNILVTPNENAPAIVPIASQTARHGSLSLHDDVVVLPHQVLDGVGSFMLDFWFRADRIQGSAIVSAAKDSGAGANEFLIQLIDAQTVRVIDQGRAMDFTVSINLNDSQWHHYAVVRDGSAGRVRLFVDGTYVGERSTVLTPAPPVTVAAGGLLLGQDQDSVGGGFQTSQAAYGQLDELRIWDRFWDHPNLAGQLALQAKRVSDIKDHAVSGNALDLRAYYAFDEVNETVAIDAGPNAWHGTLGNGLPESNPDRRFGPARADNAPIRQTARIDLATVSGGMLDPDGQPVTFTAASDDPAIAPRVSGDSLLIEYDADFATAARITVTATDEHGRQARTSLDWNVDQVLLTPGDKATSTVLTFDGGFANSFINNATYGDRVTSATQGAFRYGSGIRGPATGNVVVDYLPAGAVRFWSDDYGNLTNVVYRQGGETEPLEVVLTADPGFRVALHGFDLAGWRQTNRPIDFIEVLDETGAELYRRDGITVLGAGGTHSSFDFARPLTGQILRIRIDPGASQDNVGIDNIQFSQFTPTDEPQRFVYGSVFLDANGDGTRDAGERGVGGIAAHLLDASGQVLLCTVTDVHGNYRLQGGPALEDHTVEVILPSRWRTTGNASVALTNLEPALPVKPSLDFEYAYEFDVDPSDPASIDLDGNALADFSTFGSPVVQDGLARLVTGDGYGLNDDTTTAWSTVNPTVESGYTIKVRLKVIDDADHPEGDRGSFALTASPDGASDNSLLYIRSNRLFWATSLIDLGSFDNTDDFHTFRIVRQPGEVGRYFVWRDGVMLNPGGGPLGDGLPFQMKSRLVLGDLGAGISGHVELDYVRFTKGTPLVGGAFAPTVDFGVAKPLDIGGDRSGEEGFPQTFEPASDLTLSDIAWEVRQGSDVLATGAGESFTFTPANEGSYLVSVTARDTADDEVHGDQLWLRVRNASPNPLILVDGAPVSELTVDQGSSLTLTSLVTDPGPADWVSYYRWSINDATGTLVDAAEGNLADGDPIPAWPFAAIDSGQYEMVLQVVDDGGARGTSQPLVVDVLNVAPRMELTEITERTKDGRVNLNGSFTDPGNDPWLGEADFGDGVRRPVVLRPDRSFRSEHRYDEPGRYEVTVGIDDGQGGVDQRAFKVIYDPFAPTAILVFDGIHENIDSSGGPVFVTHLVAEDETARDAHTFELVAGDGDGDNGAFEIEGNQLMLRQGVNVDFETRNHYTIRVRTTDAVGHSHENSVTIGVNDLIELSKEAVTINDGSSQRSKVNSLTIRFDQAVRFTGDAIRVIRRDGSGTEVQTDITSRLVEGGVTLVDIHFKSGDASLVDSWGSLADGAYELNIDGGEVVNDKGFGLDAHGNGRTDETFRFGEEEADIFFRLLGDGNGDRVVNSFDFRQFRATYLRQPGDVRFDAAFDFNQDGFVNSSDFRQFRRQYLKGIPHEND